MWQNVMNFVSKTSNKGSPQIKTSKLIKVAHQIRKQPWEKIPKLIIVGATTIRQVRVDTNKLQIHFFESETISTYP